MIAKVSLNNFTNKLIGSFNTDNNMGNTTRKWQILEDGGEKPPQFPMPLLYETPPMDIDNIPKLVIDNNIPKKITKEQAEYLEEQARTKSGYIPIEERNKQDAAYQNTLDYLYNPFNKERLLKNTKELGNIGIQTAKMPLQAGAIAVATQMATIPVAGSTMGRLLGQTALSTAGAIGLDKLYTDAGGKFLGDALGVENPVGNFLLNMVSPGSIVGVGSIGKQKMFDMTDLNPHRFKKSPVLGDSANKGFKSEIDWAKWNKEIPKNKALMQEYSAIEQQAKADGTWMKNPDGSVFKGTPEQFIQQNSENFKKAFPEGYNEVWRGVNERNASVNLNPEKGVFTANKELSKNYANKLDNTGWKNVEINPQILSSLDNDKVGLFNLAHKKSINSIELDNFGREWTSIDLTNPKQSIDNINLNIKNLEKQVEKQRNWLKTGKQNSDGSWSFPDSDIQYSDYLYKQGTVEQEKILKSYKDRLENINNLVKNPKELEKMKSVLGNLTTTDDIAKYIEDVNLDYVKIKNVEDGSFGDVSIINHKKGNYLKSLVGNNGMFDMNNPNIYKAIIPTIATGIGLSQQDKKQKGGQVKKWKIIN